MINNKLVVSIPHENIVFRPSDFSVFWIFLVYMRNTWFFTMFVVAGACNSCLKKAQRSNKQVLQILYGLFDMLDMFTTLGNSTYRLIENHPKSSNSANYAITVVHLRIMFLQYYLLKNQVLHPNSASNHWHACCLWFWGRFQYKILISWLRESEKLIFL